MKYLYMGITLILLGTSVNAQEKRRTPPVITAKWLKNTELFFRYSFPDSLSFIPERKTGKNWIFEFTYTAPENPDISDDELMEAISFQVAPQKGNSFLLKNDDLLKAKTYYMLGCFCADRGSHLIREGTISGKKVNADTWLVDIRVFIDNSPDSQPKKYKGKFHFAKN